LTLSPLFHADTINFEKSGVFYTKKGRLHLKNPLLLVRKMPALDNPPPLSPLGGYTETKQDHLDFPRKSNCGIFQSFFNFEHKQKQKIIAEPLPERGSEFLG